MSKDLLLFAKGRIGGLELKNRIVLSPMCTLFCDLDGAVNDTTINWYSRRAQGGAGLVVVEATQAATSVDAYRMWSNAMRADDDAFAPGLAALARAVHAQGAKIGIQISPGAGSQASPQTWRPEDQGKFLPVSPSGIPALHSTKQSRALRTDEVERIIESCAEAALRVKNAGFDLVNLHGHGGYLMAQFLSPYFNRRKDRYGGSAENRFRFVLEMIAATRRKVGPGFPVTVKYSIDEYVEGGRGVEESQQLARRLEEAGADAIFVAVGTHGSKGPIVPPYFVPRGSHVPLAVAVKEAVKIPVVVGGRLNAPRYAEQVLREGKGDFIALGRALIADPDWPKKVAAGETAEIRPCLACNTCRQRLFTSEPVRCAINAAAGRESDYDSIRPAAVRKKVLIVGGGPAGMEAARVAALRGHAVVLCEREKRLGGLLALASVFNGEIVPFNRWLQAQIRRLPIDVRLNTEASRALIDEVKPDVTLLATGGTFFALTVPGKDRKEVFGAQDLLSLANGRPVDKGLLLNLLRPLSKHFFSPAATRFILGLNLVVGKRVVVIGGQLSGCKLAFHLARSGKKVTVVEESDSYGADMEETTMDALKYEIEDGNVRVLTSTRVNEITDSGVIVTGKDANHSTLEADTVMVALGMGRTANPDAGGLKGVTGAAHTIGDARGFRGIRDAISDGHVTACGI